MTTYLTTKELEQESKMLKSTFAKLGCDVNALVTYFLDERGFVGTAIFNGTKDAYFDFRYNKIDNYVCVLQGEITSEVNGQLLNLQKGNCFIFPAEAVHNLKIGPNGARFLIATKNGDFSAHFDLENVKSYSHL